MADDSTPMNYYRVYKDVRDFIPKDAIIQNEGASTMDIGRTLMPNFFPRHRLDAGSFGTMASTGALPYFSIYRGLVSSAVVGVSVG